MWIYLIRMIAVLIFQYEPQFWIGLKIGSVWRDRLIECFGFWCVGSWCAREFMAGGMDCQMVGMARDRRWQVGVKTWKIVFRFGVPEQNFEFLYNCSIWVDVWSCGGFLVGIGSSMMMRRGGGRRGDVISGDLFWFRGFQGKG